jgi:hypothetical protein
VIEKGRLVAVGACALLITFAVSKVARRARAETATRRDRIGDAE